jgi:pyruvate ferredoxin oxidoreductase beta subunit
MRFLKPQGRFKHMFTSENEWMLTAAQEHVDAYWERLQREQECFAPQNGTRLPNPEHLNWQ